MPEACKPSQPCIARAGGISIREGGFNISDGHFECESCTAEYFGGTGSWSPACKVILKPCKVQVLKCPVAFAHELTAVLRCSPTAGGSEFGPCAGAVYVQNNIFEIGGGNVSIRNASAGESGGLCFSLLDSGATDSAPRCSDCCEGHLRDGVSKSYLCARWMHCFKLDVTVGSTETANSSR